jgi:hypothetical protein
VIKEYLVVSGDSLFNEFKKGKWNIKCK